MSETGLSSSRVAARAPDPRRTTLAVAGCGVVGASLTRLVSGHEASQARKKSPENDRLRLHLERILVRDRRKRRPEHLSPTLFTTDPANFLRSEADVVIEALGGVDTALEIARSSLARGASFVTANKALIARHGLELERLARRAGGRLLFEGAVAGGIPVLRSIADSFAGTPIRSITGILNGTCNFVLTEMERGASFEQALDSARESGYAEADATRDLEGRDAADKIAILAWIAWGIDPADVRVRIRGILPDPQALVARASAEGRRVRLLAGCRRSRRGVRAWVRPVQVEPASECGRTVGVGNLVRVETEQSGSYAFSGPGAGGWATASALFGDVLSVARGRSPEGG